MKLRYMISAACVAAVCCMVAVSATSAQSETYVATATTASGVTVEAPVTIVVSRKMPQKETDAYLAAFKSGGRAALRKALEGVPAAGSLQVGTNTPMPIRVALERAIGGGRLITLVTDGPIAFLGPTSKPREGYDLGIIDLQVDATGKGTGTVSPAARVTVRNSAFAVEDHGGGVVTLKNVTKK